MTLTLAVIFVYILGQLAVAAFVMRRMKSESDYLLAGRSIGLGLGMMTVFATWFGAETCVGAAGAIYNDGLSGGRVDPLGYGLCILLFGIFIAAPLWRRGYTTMGDLYADRYGPGIGTLAVLILIPTSVLWAGAQIKAFGAVLTAVSDLPPIGGILIATAIVIAYTTLGGLLADAITDFVQGGILVLGLIAIAISVMWSDDTNTAIAEHAANINTSFRPEGEPWWISIETLAVPVIGSFFAQELVARTLGMKSASVARNACVIGAIFYMLLGLIPVALGLYGPALIPGLEAGEEILPKLAETYLPLPMYILFTGALVSALLSTVDSALLAAGALASHNLAVPALGIRDERQKLIAARVAVVSFGIAAFVLALTSDTVLDLVYEASAFGTAGLFTTGVFAFQTRFGGWKTAATTLVVGLLAYALFAYGLPTWISEPAGLPRIVIDTPFLSSVACAMFTYITVGQTEPLAHPPASA